jgi:lipopolysaccharide biosynthesis regulator YciM
MVWFNSLYNGYNSDEYYKIARDLAFKKDYEKSLLLCRYILSEKARHVDTKILTGRINAWRGNSEAAIEILKECIKMNPDYVDSYAALFDVYFWNKLNREALELIHLVQTNSSSAEVVADKIARAKREARKAGVTINTEANDNKTVAFLDK